MQRTSVLVGAAVLVVLGVAAVIWSDQTQAPTSPSIAEHPSVSNTATASVAAPSASPSPTTSAKKDFSLEAGSYYFKPNQIKVKQGDTVKVTISSVSMMHNFVIDELGVNMAMVPSGSSASVEFVASKSGTFQFYCGVGSHRAQGQVGTLVVE